MTDPISAYANRLYHDPLFFLDELWHATGLDRRAPLGPIERDIFLFACGFDSDGVTKLPSHRVGLAWRGIGKSTSAVAPAAAWRLYRDPERRILIPSKTDQHARGIVSLGKSWIKTVPFLAHLRPNKGQKDGEYAYEVGPASKQIWPSVQAIGIGGQLPGKRAHSIYPDDIETEANTESLEMRLKLQGQVGEFNDILFPDPAKDPTVIPAVDPNEICFFGTYHAEESLYIHLHELGYYVRTWPLVVPQPDWKILGLAPIIKAMVDRGVPPMTPTNPVRFGREEVLKRQKHGQRRFLMQHALVADIGEKARYPLRLADLIVFPSARDKAPLALTWGTTDNRGTTAIEMPTLGFPGDRLHRPIHADETWGPYQGTIAWIDPSGQGEDACAASVVSYLAGFLHWKGSLSLPTATGEDLKTLALWLRAHGVTDVYAESNADTLGVWRPLFELVLRQHFLDPYTPPLPGERPRPNQDPSFPNGWRCNIITDSKITHSTGQKEVRIIDAIEPVIRSHRLIAHPDALTPIPGKPDYAQVQYQLTHITRQRNSLREDGLIDSLAGAVHAWSYQLGLDPASAAERARAAMTPPEGPDQFQALLDSLHRRRATKEPANWITPVNLTA